MSVDDFNIPGPEQGLTVQGNSVPTSTAQQFDFNSMNGSAIGEEYMSLFGKLIPG